MTDQEDQLLLKTIIQTSKESSSFLYFTLESNEGLAFYSTRPHQIGDETREVECYTPIKLKNEFLNLLESLKTEINFIIIEQIIIKDAP